MMLFLGAGTVRPSNASAILTHPIWTRGLAVLGRNFGGSRRSKGPWYRDCQAPGRCRLLEIHFWVLFLPPPDTSGWDLLP